MPGVSISNRRSSGPGAPQQIAPWRQALADLSGGLGQSQLWLTLGWHDIRRRYRRSMIGPFWITISMAATIVGIGLLYSTLFKQDLRVYLPHLAYGLIVWGFISTTIIESCTAFIDSSSVIKQVSTPLSVHIIQMIWKNLIIFAHNIILIPIIMVVLGLDPGLAALYVLPGVVLLTVTLTGIALLLALLSARFRDIPLIITNIVQFAFFFTPILWKADQLPDRALLIWVNPFFYMTEVVRGPLMGTVPSMMVWLGALGFCIAVWAFAFAFYARYRKRVAYWI